ncbi:MAG: formylglycine-generating enzyme family protein, partial [Bradymonadaceae bacterium]
DFSTLVDTGRLLEGGAGPAEPAEPVEAAEPSGGPESAPIELDEQVPEDEIATREYDRDEDVPDESELPEPTPEVGGAASPTAPTEEYDRDGEGPEVPAGGPSPSPGGGAPPETADDGGEDEPSKPVGVMAVAGLMLAAAVALVWVQSDSSEPVRIEDDPEPKAKAAGASPDAGRRDTGPDPEVVTAAVDSARGVLSGALSPAGEQATQRAEKLAEKREKQKAEEQQESQGSGSGSAARQRGGRPPDEPPPAEGTDCPSGMVLIERDDGNYCIDRYEYPGKGKRPTTNVTWFEAKKKCRKQSKRLCKHDEWGRACGGKYPYGADWDPSACNTQDRDGFARTLKPSGDFEACESWPGTYDMVGNAFEWVAEQKIVGGGFGSGPEVANCNYSSPKEPGSSAPNIGFRCCARPE